MKMLITVSIIHILKFVNEKKHCTEVLGDKMEPLCEVIS